jgi:hypothetical protein
MRPQAVHLLLVLRPWMHDKEHIKHFIVDDDVPSKRIGQERDRKALSSAVKQRNHATTTATTGSDGPMRTMSRALRALTWTSPILQEKKNRGEHEHMKLLK